MGKVDFDHASTLELVTMFNGEDQKVANLIKQVLPDVAQAIEAIIGQLKKGGRMVYIGSGSGGKIAVLDASECPPTFGIDDDTVIAILSGGSQAAVGWLEETEDDENLAIDDLQAKNFQANDILVAVTASGTTPYALAGLRYAKQLGAPTVAVCCNKKSDIETMADLAIVVDVGEELLAGSTRLKAGTAQKMILNMLSTGSMIRLGKTYKNFMIGVRPINKKLKQRSIHIITALTGVDAVAAELALTDAAGNAKLAVLMLRKRISAAAATALLQRHQGFLSKALGDDER